MTVVTMVWVQEHVHEVRNATKAVLSYLAFRAHFDDGTAAWPAMGTIANACGINIKTVQRSIDTLLDLGLIEPGQQDFSAINPKTGRPVRANYQTIVWNVVCRESGLPEEAHEEQDAAKASPKVRAALSRARAKQSKDKMSPLKNGGNKPITQVTDKMSPLEEAPDEVEEEAADKMSEKADKMSPEYTGKYNNPSLPTGEPPANGGHPTDGDANTGTGDGTDDAATGTGGSDADDVIDRLAAMRSGLGLTTAEPTGRDLAKIERLIDAVAAANGNDRAIAKGLIARVIEWMPANAWWLGRIDSARRLADNWDRLRNEWVIDLIGQREQREKDRRDDHAAQGANRGDDRPTPCPPVYRPERHRHTLCCEHVLADMRPHESEYDHEGSLRYGNPSEWQRACQARADELNRLEGIDVAGAA